MQFLTEDVQLALVLVAVLVSVAYVVRYEVRRARKMLAAARSPGERCGGCGDPCGKGGSPQIVSLQRIGPVEREASATSDEAASTSYGDRR